MSRKNSFPSAPRWMCVLHPAHLSSLEAVGLPRIPTDQASLRFLLDGFMMRWSFDAVGPGSYASRSIGSIGPTMVLSETPGLQLFWVMRGGIADPKSGN